MAQLIWIIEGNYVTYFVCKKCGKFKKVKTY